MWAAVVTAAVALGLFLPTTAQAATTSHCTAWEHVSTVPGLWLSTCLQRDGGWTYASTTATNTGPYVTSLADLKADSSADPVGRYCGAKQLFPGDSHTCSTVWTYSGTGTVQGVGRVRYVDPVGGGVWWWFTATGFF
jgi:hypothetical protein